MNITMNIEQLNKDHAIADQLTFVEGEGGFPFAQVSNQYADAKISLYGGQVLSYQPRNTDSDLLFLSEKAYYKQGKAIKGGVPICWPWFGADPEGKGRPGHGFVRNRMWSVWSTATTESGKTIVTLGLQDTEETREIWPYAFKLSLEITIGDSLCLVLKTTNTGDKPFNITQAFHTYFSVGDIHKTQTSGLAGNRYLDKSAAGKGATQSQSGDVVIDAEVDRVYLDVPEKLDIQDQQRNRRINIRSAGNQTAVVWNPWAEIAASMADLRDDDYQRFICVETANAADNVIELPAESEFSLVAEYSASH